MKMPVDRFGRPIRLGFADHEILWIEAALTLWGRARREAFEDISAMTGRSYESIQAKAYKLTNARPRRSVPAPAVVAPQPVNGFQRPRYSVQQLVQMTGGNSRRCKTR